MTDIQCYCTRDDLIDDAEGATLPPDVLNRFILPASQYIAGEIGPFLPVIETRQRTGKDSQLLFLPPFLRLTGSITHDGTTLTGADYQLLSSLESDERAWHYGPYLLLRVDPDATNLAAWYSEPNCISIPAAWGLYERSESTGTTLGANQSDSATSLQVANGALVSPGMLLEIDDEWQFVTEVGSPSSVTTLGASLDATSETATLADGSLVNVGEVLKVGFEQMRVLDIASNNVYLARGWNRTLKASHSNGAAVSVYRTYLVTRAVNGSTAAAHTSGDAISRLVVPADVNYLARQIAMLMLKKSQTGFAGRAGNAESGDTFYLHEFPRDAIARIRALYYLPPVR